jgi:signal transduction histidine kinase
MRLRALPGRLRHPQTTVRWKLTLLYGGLFLVCGAALLGVTYGLVAHATTGPPIPNVKYIQRGGTKKFALALPRGAVETFGPGTVPPGGSSPLRSGGAGAGQITVPPEVARALKSRAGGVVVQAVVHGQQLSDLHQLELWSGIALGIMAVISAGLGWLVAGRVLRPLRTITAATQQISEENLHERLALPGPRDELGKLADTIDGLLARLEGAFDAQRRFVANASHELRTPLTSARALLEMTLSDPDATIESFRRTCKQALEENEEQEELIDALLALAQGQRGIERREPIDLAALTGEVLGVHELEVAAHGLTVDASLTPVTIAGDRLLIERLVANLVENAIRHNVPSGQIQVRVKVQDDQPALEITNSGPAVPAEDVERLLQPFQRLTRDRVGHREGVGLGLSIVAAIANAHDAALDVRPGEQGGLCVGVRFRALPSELGTTPHSELPAQPPARPAPRSPART